MSDLRICLVIVLVFCALAANGAERNIYTWTDERGNLHMTDTPPPSNATIKEVETYQDQTPDAVESVERTLQQQKDKRRVEDLQAEAAQAQRNAAATEQSAAAALERAQELTREAQDFVRRFGNTPERRKQFKYRMQAKKEMAQAAQQAAREARTVADQAKLDARKKQAAAEEALNQQADRREEELRFDN